MKTKNSENASFAKCLCEAAYSLQKSDLEQTAAVMAAAVGSDPSIRYLLGGASEGENDRQYFLAVLKAVYGKCVIISSDNSVRDVLILFPPRLKAVPVLRFLLNGGAGLSAFFGLGLFFRSLCYENNCSRVKKRFASDAWYCMCFAVLPERQGRGVGSRLLRPVLRMADDRGVPLYLETHREINTQIYGHYGFDTVDISVIPGTAVKQYAMLRECKCKEML